MKFLFCDNWVEDGGKIYNCQFAGCQIDVVGKKLALHVQYLFIK